MHASYIIHHTSDVNIALLLRSISCVKQGRGRRVLVLDDVDDDDNDDGAGADGAFTFFDWLSSSLHTAGVIVGVIAGILVFIFVPSP